MFHRTFDWNGSKNASNHQQVFPDLRIKTHGKFAIAPVYDRPLDDAGLRQHQRLRAGAVDHGQLRIGIQLAPRRAFAIQQAFPADRIGSARQFWSRHAVFFEVMKFMASAVFSEPRACFFNRVAIGNAVKRNQG